MAPIGFRLEKEKVNWKAAQNTHLKNIYLAAERRGIKLGWQKVQTSL